MDDLVKLIWYIVFSYIWGLGVFDMFINVDGYEKFIIKLLYGVF